MTERGAPRRVVAELKDLFCSDFDLEDPPRVDLDARDVWLQATIGPKGVEGGDNYQFQVASPAWLAARHADGRPTFVALILAERFDARALRHLIENLCRHTSGVDWHEVSWRLQRFGHSEFEDYREYTGGGV